MKEWGKVHIKTITVEVIETSNKGVGNFQRRFERDSKKSFN